MIPADPDYLFIPALPGWYFGTALFRFHGWGSTYAALAAEYYPTYPSVYAVGNVTLDDVNAILQQYVDPNDSIAGPWLATSTAMGRVWTESYWPDDGTDPETNTFGYFSAACTGLAVWQMYAIMVRQQALRFTKGHFGRKPNGGHNNG